MDEVQKQVSWKLWLFGHYHSDRIELPHVEMFSFEIEPLNAIIERWEDYDNGGELAWYIPQSPKM